MGRSGDKDVSKFYQAMIDKYGDEALDPLANYIGCRFDTKWQRLYDALETEYSLLDNYNYTEKENVGSKVTNSTSTDNNVYGFNSPTTSPTQRNSIESISSGSKSDNERELSKHGLLNETPQSMISREFEMRKLNLYNIIYKDVDGVLASDIYNED